MILKHGFEHLKRWHHWNERCSLASIVAEEWLATFHQDGIFIPRVLTMFATVCLNFILFIWNIPYGFPNGVCLLKKVYFWKILVPLPDSILASGKRCHKWQHLVLVFVGKKKKENFLDSFLFRLTINLSISPAAQKRSKIMDLESLLWIVSTVWNE